jgi:hypothetical protein
MKDVPEQEKKRIIFTAIEVMKLIRTEKILRKQDWPELIDTIQHEFEFALYALLNRDLH